MKTQKRVFITLVILILLISSLQVIANAEPRALQRSSYSYCWNRTSDFESSYNDSVECEITVIMSLQDTNNAVTTGTGIVNKTWYKEAYVGIKNSNGTWKTDISSNEVYPYVTANINPVAFTPILSHHEVIAYESASQSQKNHSRIYQ